MTYEEFAEAYALLRDRIMQLRATAIVLGEQEQDATRDILIVGCNESATVLVKALHGARQAVNGNNDPKKEGH